MSEHRETSSRPMTQTTRHQPQQPGDDSTNTVATPKDKRRKRSSTSSIATATDVKSHPRRRRSDNSKTLTAESDVGSSRTVQRSTPSPHNMSSVNYTKTGRVSKAKKGLKIHDCECGRSYTRAEHLRRHQRNHAQEGALVCRYPSCGKTFYRSDLLQRHEERHDELGGNMSPPSSISSCEHSAHASPMAVPASLPLASADTLQAMPYPYQLAMSPQPEVSAYSRYNPIQFRTPQLPRTPKVAPAKSINFLFQSTSSFKTPPNGSKHTQNPVYAAQNPVSGPAIVDVMATSVAWAPESFAPSPYSCSSGYASPAPCPEYGHMYATPPYGAGMVRTRASSNASFVEQNWLQASQSPASSISMPYSWASDEKSIIASTFSYAPVAYSTTNMSMHSSIGAVGHYGQYDPQNLGHLDNEEGGQLFPGEHYGMSQLTRAYPFEQWLNNYWRLFHPTFPIVHRFTFAGIKASPMLRAAMAAIGAHYSNDSYNARGLHDRCVKLLTKRRDTNVIGCNRLCDLQAVFLVEVFALNFAHRCARTLSTGFIAMYHQLSGTRSADPSVVTNALIYDSIDEDSVEDRWLQWAKLSMRHRLLVSCYLLDSQHRPILTDDRKSPSIRILVDDLHFPSHETLWEAPNARQWWTGAQAYSTMPRRIAEAAIGQISGCYDAFQSSVLIAALYGPFSCASSHLYPAIEHLLNDSMMSQQQLGIAKLVKLVPVPALLAVSGESWILGTKVTSQEEFAAYKATLQTWVAQIWSTQVENHPQMAVEAMRTAAEILTKSLDTHERFRLPFGNELGIFYAVLVLWAATASASNRLAASGFSTQQTRPLPVSQFSAVTILPPISYSRRAPLPAFPSSIGPFPGLQQDELPASSDGRSLLSHAEIVANASHFLSTVVTDVTSFNVAACQTGCKNLLLWMKMQLRRSHTSDQASIHSGLSTEHVHGELINEAIGQIEKMLTHGWEGWGI